MNLWPWQQRGIDETMRLLYGGELGVCVQSPTGMGKGVMIEHVARMFANAGGRVVLYSNRRFLTKQTGDRMAEAGFDYGYAASGYAVRGDGTDLDKRILVASAQTVLSKTRSMKWELPQADLAIFDEAHNKTFFPLMDAYREISPGTAQVLFTATPVGLSGRAAVLVTAGTKQEGRAGGALVPCSVVAPSEPDLQGVTFEETQETVKPLSLETCSEKELTKRTMQCVVFADVFTEWDKNNPWRWPTLLWAPGVPESRWFAEEFERRGIPARHVDGDTDQAERDATMAAHKSGEVKVITSCGVLREGLDMPWARVGILVQVCRGLSTYLQIVGRLLRAAEGKDSALLLDHSGAFHRLGSPNSDRVWELGDTDKKIRQKLKKDRERGEPAAKEPICCPRCHAVRAGGPRCHACGFEHARSVRMVRTVAGELVAMTGPVVKPKPKPVNDAYKAWQSTLYAAARGNRTLNQAAIIYRKRQGHDVPLDAVPQPAPRSIDWDRKASEVYPQYAGRKAVTT